MGSCITTTPKTDENKELFIEDDGGGLIETPEPEMVDLAEADSGSEEFTDNTLESEPFTPICPPKYLKKRTSNISGDSLLQEIFNQGILKEATAGQLKGLWEKFKNGIGEMGIEEVNAMLLAFVEFCQDFSTNQMKWRKYEEKRQSFRSNEEIEFSKRASRTIRNCNTLRARLGDLAKSPNLFEELFGTRKFQLTEEDFLRRGNGVLTKLKEMLDMQSWAGDSVDAGEFDPDKTPIPCWLEELKSEQSKLNREFSEGSLKIRVIGALDLVPKEGTELCSPYAILSVANRSVPTVFRSDTKHPEWSQAFKFQKYTFHKRTERDPRPKERGHLHIMDWCIQTKQAHKLCSATFDLPDDYMDAPRTIEVPLKLGEDQTQGFVMLSYTLTENDVNSVPTEWGPTPPSTDDVDNSPTQMGG